jgi:hypothetical protein
MASSFEDARAKCDVLVASLPAMDYNALKSEVRAACKSVQISSNTMTPNDLAKDMETIQAARDRVVEILANAQENYTIRKDVAKMLTAAAKKNSAESSSDRREGDAAIKIAEYFLEQTKAESFYRYCETMYGGLDSQYASVSKRINCMQESVRINAYGGGSNMVADMAMPRSTADKFGSNSKGNANGGGSDSSTQKMDWDNL